MNEVISINTIFLYMCFWFIGLIMMLSRPRVEVVWKIIACVIFALFIFILFDEFKLGLNRFISGWYIYSLQFFKELLMYLFSSLFFLWPLALTIVFYKADALGSEKILKFMCLLTLVLLLISLIYAYNSKGIDRFLIHHIKKNL